MKKDESYYLYLETELLNLRDAIMSLLTREDILLLERDFKQIDQFIHVGEYGLAFEDLCAVIKDANVLIPSRFKQKIFTLSTLMDIEEEKWANIQYGDADNLEKESG